MTDLSPAGQRLHEAREALALAIDKAKASAVADVRRGLSEVQAARRNNITRPTLRKALGKDQ